jgi:putative Mg2+ transporter-C (MgtC) family protein
VHISDGEILLRLVASAILCGAIGLERESRDQVAGLRTHILVGVGATLFTLVSAYAFESGGNERLDPTRISAQIVSGIGFLGAGAIIRQGFNVRGLTTAAALWIVAAIGMATGAGYWFGAGIATVIVLASLIVFRRIRPFLMSRVRTDFVLLSVELDSEKRLADLFATVASHGMRVQGISSESEGDRIEVELQLRVPPGLRMDELVQRLAAEPWATRVSASDVGMAHRRITPEDD